jgi:hypothetical protein
MDQEKALEWAKQQSVVRVRTVKENEEDKFTFMVGEYLVSPLMFNTQKEAERYLKENFKLTNLELAVIGAICHKIKKLSEEQLNTEGK